MRYGLHIKTLGDIVGTPARAKELGAEAFQFFAGSPRTFRQASYDQEQVEGFKAACAENNLPAFIHMMYLTAYGTPDKEMRRKSIDAAVHTMRNAEQLGVK